MTSEITSSPWETLLRFREPHRWGSIILLGMCLFGWGPVEYLVAKQVRSGLKWMLAAAPDLDADLLPQHDPFGTCFLVFWLGVWTLAGTMLGVRLLRMLFGHDRITLTSDGLEIARHFGLYRTRQMISRAGLRFFHPSPAEDALHAATNQGTQEVTRMGTARERAALEHTLNSHYGLIRPDPSTRLLPSGWCETQSLEGEPILIPDPIERRQVARIPEAAFALTFAFAGYLLTVAPHRPQFWTSFAWSLFFACLSGWAAAQSRWTQQEWVLGRGQLSVQRRIRNWKSPRFEAGAIELVESSDGEGCRSFDLIAIALDAPATPKGRKKAKYRRKIASILNQADMRSLGLWLSERCQIPLTDLNGVVTQPAGPIHE